MNIHWILFGLLLAMCAVIGFILAVEELPFREETESPGAVAGAHKVYLGHGYVHSQFKTMDQGGVGQTRHEGIFWLALAFGVLMLTFMVGLLVLGAKKENRKGPITVPIVLGGVLWAGIFTLLVLSYRGYMAEDSHVLFLALPKPMAWFVYGFWPFQAFFVVLYIFTFKRVFLTEDDAQKFREILEARGLQDGGEA